MIIYRVVEENRTKQSAMPFLRVISKIHSTVRSIRFTASNSQELHQFIYVYIAHSTSRLHNFDEKKRRTDIQNWDNIKSQLENKVVNLGV